MGDAPEVITSRHNQRLEQVRMLRRGDDELVLLEGPLLVAEAVAAGRELETLLATPAFLSSAEGRRLLPVLPRRPTEVGDELLAEGADTDSPRGVAAVARLPRSGCGSLPRSPGIYLFLDAVQNPGNLGAIVRVAEAAGAMAVACGTGCAHPNHPRAMRGSAGSLLRLPVAHRVTPGELAAHLGPGRPEWLALDAAGDTALWGVETGPTVVLALGGEGGGLSAEVRRLATVTVTIPMRPPVESLNVATAAAVALFELARRLGGR